MGSIALSQSPPAEVPGPSAAKLANPVYGAGIGLLYTCVTNYYVNASTGNDSNPGTQTQPWLTIQHADTVPRAPGDCINVAPGTYTWTHSFIPQNGGNLSAPTGYVTYRCETLDQCFILFDGTFMGSNGQAVIGFVKPYFIFDGFDVDGGEQFMYGGIATACFDAGLNDLGGTGHHIWILNNNVHGCGIGCIGLSDSEYFFMIHNNASDCAFTDQFEGSGIGLVALKRLGDNLNPYPPYTPTAADLAFAPFTNMMSWNRVFNNGCTVCLGILNTFTTTANTHSSTTIDNIASLGTSASFTGSIPSGMQILTVTGITGTISPGDQIFGAGTFQTTFIYPYGTGGTTGTGGNGTYFISVVYPTGFSGALTSTTLGEGVLITGPGVQPFTYISSITGNTATVTRPTLTTQSGASLNFIAPGAGHTDGNGIINDTWCGTPCGGTGTDPYNYPDHQTLVSFNDVQFNGGRGMHNFGVNYVTTANNSFYHDGLDLFLAGAIGELSEAGGNNNSWYSNAAFATQNLVTDCNFSGVPCNFCVVAGDGRGADVGTKWFNNVVFGPAVGGTCVALFNNDATYWVPTNNKGDIDPKFIDETSDTVGNLQLQFPASPAINYANSHAFYFLPKGTSDSGAYQTGGIRIVNYVGLSPDFTSDVGYYTTPPIPTPLSCAQATAFLIRAATVASIDRVHHDAYSDLICGMVNDGTWCGSYYDVFYIFATVNSALAQFNLCSDTNYNAILNGNPAFTPDRGFAGVNQSTTIYIDPQFNPSTVVGANYSLNSAHVSVWSLTNTIDSNPAYAVGTSPQLGFFSGITNLMPSEPSGTGFINPYANVNNTNFGFFGPSQPLSSSVGYYVANLSGTTITEYKNGASLFSYTNMPTPVLCNIFILANNSCSAGGPSAEGGSSLTIAHASIGSDFSAVVGSVCHRLDAYLVAVGNTSQIGAC
jgi:hypothetical protein